MNGKLTHSISAFLAIVFLLAGCAAAGKNDPIASINGENITARDVAFYQSLYRIELAVNHKQEGKAQAEKVPDNNAALTQLIRLRSMALLAREKGYEEDQKAGSKLNEEKKQYRVNQAVLQIIKAYGEEEFWKKEQIHQKELLLAAQVKEDIVKQAIKEKPGAGQQEIAYLANQNYEELLVSQVSSLKITFFNKEKSK
ncbi:hypothetical protein [Aneurinibacillus tyrosinisolvens]|uniref:hypothetical protein n=1 Tax=Aneurinibacillus tyrosinisolvens TaxID=1443435 RepID=UPI00069BCF76|nr:hypothetical protein [Aneurinibacillus tyrosinisolvens]